MYHLDLIISYMVAQAANLTDEQFTELWQEYVSAAAECLLRANDDIESEAGQRLVRTSMGLVLRPGLSQRKGQAGIHPHPSSNPVPAVTWCDCQDWSRYQDAVESAVCQLT
jgi:hypothetical protein